MENYVVVDVMCPGSFGMTFLVEDRNSGLEYTLKKVECLDETRANRSLQEALCLLNVNHPNIVRYRELFVLWDKHITSSMLSMVMDCPYMTTLKIVISSQREQKEKFEDKCIQMFLGQMVDALAYLHNRNILHRNLKPSNILMSSDSVFRICDFGTATITQDRAKIHIRIKESEKCWMAPESVRLLQWSDKSDIWSLGCVLLDMLICHILNEEASLSQLSQLRQDLSPLDFIICKDLRKLLTRMLSHNLKTRANVWVLANEALVKQCLILCGSSPHSIKRTLPQGVTGPPFHEGIDSVLDFMMTYTDVEAIQLSVLSHLLKVERNALGRIGDVVEAVTSAMLSHSESACIQLKSFQLLQLLLSAGQYIDKDCCLCGEKVISCVLEAVQNNPKNTDLLANAFQVLLLISVNEKACELIVKLDSVRQVLNTLKDYPQEKDIIIPCCKIIQCTLEKGYGAPESFPDAVETLCIVGEMHLQDAVVTECLCAALQFLISQALHEEKDIEKATCVLMHELKSHPNEATIVNHVFVAMAGLIKTSETAALQLLHVLDERNGVYHIIATRRHHSDCPKVTENFCNLLKQLVQHDAIIPELLAENVQEELEQILQQYESITETVLLAQDALSKMMSLNDVESTSSA
ncbi:serine/threonine kinase-like domain-containing protein STKLD1 [Pangasianodon hypophthalmus]|uniref:serine/threonine kinase-like domain-containing protein STKLD1 n=1 Tax=Pangasianodon hypophthalmus TaxID=310915 RepID=UPI002308072B|nr:serine/threonine kinase-like domain-containing protein STKLD1 [Pangasianodon hypophthalmus]